MAIDSSAQAGLKLKPKVGIWHAGGAASDGGYLRERAFDHGSMATAEDAILKVSSAGSLTSAMPRLQSRPRLLRPHT